MRRAAIAVSVGCPAGIGPEVALRAAAKLRKTHPDTTLLLVGDTALLTSVARTIRGARRPLVVVEGPEAIADLDRGSIGLWQAATRLRRVLTPGRPTAAAGRAQLAWIDEACDLVSQGWCDALVTGPVSKAFIAKSGTSAARRFRGHTEHLAATLGADEAVMAFHSEALTTALVTTHLPLAEVPRAITRAAVSRTCFWLVDLLTSLGGSSPRVAVAGLNPHAGEGGLLGGEERAVIAPGIALCKRRLRRQGIAAELVGPIGAESAYRLAAAGHFDGVVAMYHDQATIAGKLLGFGEMVNVTLGLPIVRTSVDHGTAYDRAGSDSASAAGMMAAVSLAIRLVKR